MQNTVAIVAQLVELWLPKPKVAGSSPVYRSVVMNEIKKTPKVCRKTFGV